MLRIPRGALMALLVAVAFATPALAQREATQATAWTARQAPLISGQAPVLYGAAAASPRVVWAAGSRGPANVALTTEVIKSIDAGQTWFVQYRSSECCEARDIVAASSADLWLVRAGNNLSQVMSSRDGGDSWLVEATVNEGIWSIAAASTKRAWASGSAGLMLVRDDSGSWRRVQTSTAANLWETAAGSESIGWVVGDDGTVLKTTDAGTSWRAQPSTTFTTLLGVDAAGSDVVWAVGQAGTIIKSTDGGATWRAQTSGVTADLSDVVAVSPSHAWALATREDGPAIILGTRDGGTTWSVEYQATRAQPRLVGGLAASGPYAAWVVGGGTILSTTTATSADRGRLPLLPRGPAD
jgi:photosystem II stability/assembly factor-like uncharacterized protein